MVLVLVLVLLLVDKLHLNPPTARRHRLDRRPLPVAEVRVMVSTCMPGGSSERHSASSEALSVIRGPQRHQRGTQRHERGTQRTCRRGARIGPSLARKPPSAAPALDESGRSGASSESPSSAVVSTCNQGRAREIKGDRTWSVEREPIQRRRGALEARARPIVLRSAAWAPDEGAHQWCDDQHAIKVGA